jgi:predicted RNA binding protein YcfA (HicA-like mRNA interferase family)
MRDIPSVTAREMIAALHKAGFFIMRSKGSHQLLRHQDDPSRRTPIHRARLRYQCIQETCRPEPSEPFLSKLGYQEKSFWTCYSFSHPGRGSDRPNPLKGFARCECHRYRNGPPWSLPRGQPNGVPLESLPTIPRAPRDHCNRHRAKPSRRLGS